MALGFVTHFLGELIFSHGQMIVTVEVVEIALTVTTQQLDLAPIVLAETYRALDSVSHRCRHFYGCGILMQIWLAVHIEMDILRP